MRERSTVSALRRPRTWLLGFVALCWVLAVSACSTVGNTPRAETAHIYDNAHVLNTTEVQKAAQSVPANVDVYTVAGFTGTQADFQRAMATKVGNDPGRIVVGLDPQNHYQVIARGSHVPLSTANIVQASNEFSVNYGNSNYTRATVAQLHSLGSSIRANGAITTNPNQNRTGGSPWTWLIPLLILGAILFALAYFRRPQLRMLAQRGPIYRPRPPEGRRREAPPFPTVDQATYQRERERGLPERETGEQGPTQPPTPDKGKNGQGTGGRGTEPKSPFGYELEKRPGEPKPPNSDTPPGSKGVSGKKPPDAGPSGGRFGQAGPTPKPPDAGPSGGRSGQAGPTPKPSDAGPSGGRFGQTGPTPKPPDAGPSGGRFGQTGLAPKPPDISGERPKQAGPTPPTPKPPDTSTGGRFGQAGPTPKPPETSIGERFGPTPPPDIKAEERQPGGIDYDPNKIISEGRFGQENLNSDPYKPGTRHFGKGESDKEPNGPSKPD